MHNALGVWCLNRNAPRALGAPFERYGCLILDLFCWLTQREFLLKPKGLSLICHGIRKSIYIQRYLFVATVAQVQYELIWIGSFEIIRTRNKSDFECLLSFVFLDLMILYHWNKQMFPLNLARILANQTDHEQNTDHVTKLMSLAEIVNLTMIHFEQFKNQH